MKDGVAFRNVAVAPPSVLAQPAAVAANRHRPNPSPSRILRFEAGPEIDRNRAAISNLRVGNCHTRELPSVSSKRAQGSSGESARATVVLARFRRPGRCKANQVLTG